MQRQDNARIPLETRFPTQKRPSNTAKDSSVTITAGGKKINNTILLTKESITNQKWATTTVEERAAAAEAEEAVVVVVVEEEVEEEEAAAAVVVVVGDAVEEDPGRGSGTEVRLNSSRGMTCCGLLTAP